MAGVVLFREGDILKRGGVDLTILPCSAKGSFSVHAKVHVERIGIPHPVPKTLGEVEFLSFDPPGDLTRALAWAASVLNDKSSEEAIRSIGCLIGDRANERRDVRLIESPLLGTGAGRLGIIEAGLALHDGFLAACRVPAVLIVYHYTAEYAERLSASAALRSDSTVHQ